MQPSSLIFLVLIAIWAAYLLQHWVRRREHLATARSVDRFSAAMRVLERRGAPPGVDLSAPRPRSYAHSPARPSPSEVVVKSAQSPSPQVPKGPPAAVRPTRIFHILAGVSARRLRGLSLLVALLLTLAVAPLVAFSLLPWWSILVAISVLTADVCWLRHVALSVHGAGRGSAVTDEPVDPERPAARESAYFGDGAEAPFEFEAEAHAESEPETPAGSGPRSEAPFGADSNNTIVMSLPEPLPEDGADLLARFESRSQWKSEAGTDSGWKSEPETGWRSESGWRSEPEPGAAAPAPAPVPVHWAAEPTVAFAPVDLSGWAPVPVPPPTYTLKAKAPDPVPEPAPESAAEPVVTEPTATGPWSLEGLVYDCELDDLVERRSGTGA